MATGLPLLPGFLSRFIEHWADRRQPPRRREITLHRRRIYILPTRAGIAFFVVLLVILLGAINYENSLGFMLTFLLGSIGFLSMLYTHQNINRLHIRCLPATPVFAGQSAAFPLHISGADTGRSHINIKFQIDDADASSASVLPGERNVELQVSQAAPKRGRLALNKMRVFCEFPLGLFHAWSWVELQAHCLVYPAPANQPLHVQHRGRQGELSSTDNSGSDDFAGIREYQKGDAPNHLAWKAIARSGQLQTKQFHAEAGNEIWLSWYQFADTVGLEQRLSVLCRWILDAEHKGIRYGLELPGWRSAPDAGLHHRQLCLQQLALFGETPAP